MSGTEANARAANVWTIYSEAHLQHQPRLELVDGELRPSFEKPERAIWVVQQIVARGLGPVAEPAAHSLEAAARVHSADYLHYLEHAWTNWTALGRTRDIIPYCFPVRGMKRHKPSQPDGLAGYFAMDGGAPITSGTWHAARSSVDCALTALERITRDGERAAFALCRPPGHHAGVDYLGGYCYLNNTAIAAQRMIDSGCSRVAVLDIDYHHGNGTQQIFYERDDVLFVSLHGDPAREYPFFLGYADERGAGHGLGFNLNLPLAQGADYPIWAEALNFGCSAIASYSPDALIVSLGVDTYKNDPISTFKLDGADFLRVGERLAAMALPTLFVMEGGYAVDEIGVNVANVLDGFEGAHS
jgi:acetoin utilization deacetylase AcuC-like enzyme